jgi:hypothetical protein
MNTNKCLLTEFDRKGFHWLFKLKRPGLLLAILCCGWALLTAVVGHFAKANGIALTVLATAVPPATTLPDLQGRWRQTFGYLAETNFGFFFIVVAPLLIYLAFSFLLSAGRALYALQANNILRPGRAYPTTPSPIEYVSLLNRRLFVYCLLVPLITIPACLYVQFSSFNNVSHGYPPPNGDIWELGHVQSPYLPAWLSFFNGLKSDLDRLSVLEKGHHVDDVAGALLQRTLCVGQKAIQDMQMILSFPADNSRHPVALRLDDAVKHGIVKLHAEAKGYADSESAPQMALFLLFVGMSQIQVGMMFAFEFWILCKTMFWLALIYRFLPRPGETQRYKLEPQLKDPEKRFGFGELFGPYDMIVFMIALGALYYGLQVPEAGTIVTDPSTWSLTTRLVNVVAFFIPVSAIVIGPIIGFAFIMWYWKAKRKRQLDEERERANQRRQMEIDAEKKALKAQTTWPKRDKWFWIALIAVLVPVVPISCQFAGMPINIRKYISAPYAIKMTIHTLVRHFYNLTDAEEI